MHSERVNALYIGKADTSPRDFNYIPFIGVNDGNNINIYYLGLNKDFEGVHELLVISAEYKTEKALDDPIGGGVLEGQTFELIRGSGDYGPLDDDLLDKFVKELENNWK